MAQNELNNIQAGINTPEEIIQMVEGVAEKKYRTPFPKLLTQSILAGVYIAMGGVLSIVMGYGFPGLAESMPAFGKFTYGLFFSLALIIIVLVGAELFTGNTAYLVVGARSKRVPWRYIPYNWSVVYLGNLLGAMFFLYFFVYLTGGLAQDPWLSGIQTVGEGKVFQPWGVAFLKGIAANWFVCLALWLGMSSRSMIGRLMGLMLPVMAFVTLGYEHSIANMFYLPIALLRGADYTVWEAVWNNLIPVTLGNIIGGSFFVGSIYAWLYGKK